MASHVSFYKHRPDRKQPESLQAVQCKEEKCDSSKIGIDQTGRFGMGHQCIALAYGVGTPQVGASDASSRRVGRHTEAL
jgi:hypothetical protein